MLPALQARLLATLGRQRAGAIRRVHILAAQQAQSQQGSSAAERRQPALSVVAATPTATQLLATYFACELHPSDCYLLHGSVGAGKSYFSRAFIRAAADDDALPVPSPTFLLQNIYTDHEGPPIHHFDLYRLEQRYDLARLDLAASFAQAVCLVEWPERLAGAPVQPVEPLDVHISILDAAEQAQLQERLQQQRAAQHGSGDGGAAAAGAAGGEEDEEELGSSSSDEEGSGDHRWRRIQLLPSGERWQPRLQLLRRYLRVEGAQAGCYIEGEPS